MFLKSLYTSDNIIFKKNYFPETAGASPTAAADAGSHGSCRERRQEQQQTAAAAAAAPQPRHAAGPPPADTAGAAGCSSESVASSAGCGGTAYLSGTHTAG